MGFILSRAPTVGVKAVVATSHQLASFSGANILKNGGNFVDAAIAASAVLCVVQNNLCGLGGDTFALVKPAGKKIEGVNGSGRASSEIGIDWYRSRGYSEIPQRGPHAAITVPGLVHAWGELHRRYGSMEFRNLLEPAIQYAEAGVPLTPNYADSIKRSRDSLERFPGWARIFVPDGNPPSAGSIFVQKELAASLRTIANEGPDTMYTGTLAQKMVRGIRREGGVLSETDFAKHRTDWVQPLSTKYRGIDVYETAPNSQGATVLLWLNLLEELNLSNMSPGEILAKFVDTYKMVNEERRKRITDPEFHQLPPDFTSKSYAAKLVTETTSASGTPVSVDPGDTTYFSVADSEGNCISMIQSNYMGFGSGMVPEGTGIVLQNRGCYFSLDPTHHNRLEPSKRTFHTLCACIGLVDERPLFCIGEMGGDIQPQVHVQLITNLIDRGMNIQAAIDSPRWCIPGTIYESPKLIQCEEGLFQNIGKSRISELDIQKLQYWSSATGHAQGVFYLKDGISAGADPRGDGAAVGF